MAEPARRPRGSPAPRAVQRKAATDLDRIIHERARLAIVSALAVHDKLTFNELKALLETTDGAPPRHKQEEAREAGWEDEQILEAVAHVALSEFQSLMANAAALPQDQSDPSVLPAAA